MNAKINEQLNPLVVPISAVREDVRNARKHTPKNLRRIKRSLRKFGQQKPIVTMADGTILAGNGTYRMAKLLGWEKIARIQYDSADDLQARAFAIADNKSTEGAGWNKTILDELLEEFDEDPNFDMADIGFEDDDDVGLDINNDENSMDLKLTYSVIVDFTDELEQAALLKELEARGLNCRLLIA